MADFDAFNGDADGVCALVQLRLAEPRESTLITGVKRDIGLAKRIEAGAGDRVTVLDVSLDKNRDDIQRILDAGATVHYVDHHYAGEIPDSPKLTAHINTASDVCTSLLVNGELKNQFIEWALVGAFGDNLSVSARTLAKQTELSDEELEQLEELGIAMNYNGYGSSLDDLHFTPEALYREAVQHRSPLTFLADAPETSQTLIAGYKADMASAESTPLEPVSNDDAAFLILPNEPWARRVSGVFGNSLANASPDRAHAVLTEKANGNYLISVRAPLNRKSGADELCRQFPTGGGRAAAAGINDLPAEQFGVFVDAMKAQFAT
ncbi:acetyltransferase [uncultured Abyssibacter sp.]|uniref:acetyltransferase n=1 Tax=uncultured Abyssibacter sp. TaxID=2320202 RepID=UPI0032B20A41